MNRRLFADARPRTRGLLVAERLLLAVWVGGMLAVGYLAVPVLFHMLDDRVLAGALAGEMFRYMNGVGLVCGALLLVSALVSSGPGGLRSWRSIVIAIMLAVAVTILFVLQPQMAALKAEAAAAFLCGGVPCQCGVAGRDRLRLRGCAAGGLVAGRARAVGRTVAQPRRLWRCRCVLGGGTGAPHSQAPYRTDTARRRPSSHTLHDFPS